MKFISICSGIDAASVAFNPLGWKAVAFSEIEPFPCAVLAHHYPDVPNLGDMTKYADWPEEIFAEADAIVGGPPCQAFSVAGLRNGLNDERGNLTLTYFNLINHADSIRKKNGRPPVIALYENVPGLLSDKTGAFGGLLAGLAGEDEAIDCKKWPRAGVVDGGRRRVAWVTLDAQYFGIAQRRRRVFVLAVPCEFVERLGNRAHPAEILSVGNCLRGNTPSRRETGQGTAHATSPCLTSSGRGVERTGDTRGQDPVVAVASTLDASYGRLQGCSGQDANHGHSHLVPTAFGGNRTSGSIEITPALLAHPGSGYKGDFESETFLVQPVTHSLRGEGFDTSEDGTGRGTPIVPVAQPLPFDTTQLTSVANRSNPKPGAPCHPLAAGAHAPAIAFPANLSGTQCASAENLSPALGALNPTAVAFALQDVRDVQKAQNGRGWSDEGVAYTVDTHATQGVALSVSLRGREGGATAELGDEVGNCLRASSGGGDKPHVLAPVAYTTKMHNTQSNQAGKFYEEYSTSLDRSSPPPAVIAPAVAHTEIMPTMTCGGGHAASHNQVSGQMRDAYMVPTTAMQVRRLTPEECEALQGFPRGYTNIPWTEYQRVQRAAAKAGTSFEAELTKRGKVLRTTVSECPDGPRYKALGNSWAVPNVRWIGQRIAAALAQLGDA